MHYLATFILFAILLLGMAIGLILAKKPLQKGCNITSDEECPICKRPPGNPCNES
jgi:hypothetical protein